MIGEKVIGRRVTMYEAQWEIAREIAKDMFEGNYSRALRFIVSDWNTMRNSERVEDAETVDLRAAAE